MFSLIHTKDPAVQTLAPFLRLFKLQLFFSIRPFQNIVYIYIIFSIEAKFRVNEKSWINVEGRVITVDQVSCSEIYFKKSFWKGLLSIIFSRTATAHNISSKCSCPVYFWADLTFFCPHTFKSVSSPLLFCEMYIKMSYLVQFCEMKNRLISFGTNVRLRTCIAEQFFLAI